MTATLIRTEADAEQAFQAFGRSDRLLCFDTETTGLNVRGPGQDTPRTIQFSWRPWEESVVFETTPRWAKWVEDFFAAADEVLAFNLRFDVHVLDTYLGFSLFDRHLRGTLHDAYWVARLHDERDRARLKDLAAKYVNADAASEQASLKRLMTKHGWNWATVPVEHLIEYGGNDAVITGQLFDTLYPRISHSKDAYRLEQDLAPVLYQMERTGLLVDTEALSAYLDTLRAEVDKWERSLNVLAPGLNPNSPVQVLAAFRDRGHEIPDTQAPTLRALYVEESDDLAGSLLAYRKYAKTLRTYAEPWLNLIADDGRIHPSLNQMGTITGRFSSDHPNFQNIPKGSEGMRSLIVAEPGHRLVVADWNQMELRLYAHFAQDENMRAAFLSGDDIYQQAADLLGVERAVGKMVMLASIYGAGPKTLSTQVIAMAYRFGLDHLIPSLRDLDWHETHARFHASYAIKDLARLTELAARRRGMHGEGYIRTLGGRRQRPKRILLPAVNGYRPTVFVYKDLGNSLVQGSSADLMKRAIIAASDMGLHSYLRLTVHDELVLEVPEAEVPEVRRIVSQVMTRNEFVPPLTIETTDAYRYGDAK